VTFLETARPPLNWVVDRSSVLVTILLLCVVANAPLRAEPAPHDDQLQHASPQALRQLSNDRIRQRMIQENIARYHGRCACPYQVDTRGHSCRGRVPIRRGAARICFPGEITDQMVASWRAQHR
jgi:hypothetical protein